MYVFVPCVCLITMEVKGGTRSLDLELQMAVSHHMGVRTKPESSKRIANAVDC